MGNFSILNLIILKSITHWQDRDILLFGLINVVVAKFKISIFFKINLRLTSDR